MFNIELRLLSEQTRREEDLFKSKNICGKKYSFNTKKSLLSIFPFLTDNEINYLYKIRK